MNPIAFAFAPIDSLWRAVSMPLRAAFVIGICYAINRFTSPAHPWWHWVAFGMGIAVLVAWARAARTIVLLIAAYYVGRWIYRKYGDDAKARFDAWMAARAAGASAPRTSSDARRSPDSNDVLRLLGNEPALRAEGIVH
ncbi:MAG TPA: hypothetical protein VMU33_20550 [Burkholderiaceae bacterium]|nr:hypothetical protein [Burkholderiaceae bacterium]